MTIYNLVQDLSSVLSGKSVALRVDLNVPIVDGKITDPSRILEILPTLRFLLEGGAAKVVLLSHFGRPKPPEKKPEFSLSQVVSTLAEACNEEVDFGDIAGKSRVVLLENLRYNKEEELGDETFAKSLAEMCDFYVNDAFSCSHRPHASISVVAKFTKIYAGLLMQKEIASLEAITGGSGKKLAIVGGSKVSTKAMLLKNLLHKVEYIAVTGGMANTFLHALGFNVGASLCEKTLASLALEIMEEAKKAGCEILLPSEVVVCKKIENGAESRVVSIKDVASDEIIADAGEEFVFEVARRLERCELVAWNGPLGVFEVPPFDVGTESLARVIAGLTSSKGLKSIIGGGDTASAVLKSGLKSQMTYTSTAGGAFLEWLEGRVLPGVQAVTKR